MSVFFEDSGETLNWENLVIRLRECPVIARNFGGLFDGQFDEGGDRTRRLGLSAESIEEIKSEYTRIVFISPQEIQGIVPDWTYLKQVLGFAQSGGDNPQERFSSGGTHSRQGLLVGGVAAHLLTACAGAILSQKSAFQEKRLPGSPGKFHSYSALTTYLFCLALGLQERRRFIRF